MVIVTDCWPAIICAVTLDFRTDGGMAGTHMDDLVVQRDLRVPMRDGVVLLADRWTPKAGGEGLPTLLQRDPLGRDKPARRFARAGFQVLIQSVRGTFGSGGTFDRMRQERADGQDTLDWVIRQPWFGGSIVLYGTSYAGYSHWATADVFPPEVRAMIAVCTESAISNGRLNGRVVELEGLLSVIATKAAYEGSEEIKRTLTARVAQAGQTLPLNQADITAIDRHDDYFQSVVAGDGTADRADADHSGRVAHCLIPVSVIAGWYDVYLPGQLRDFRVLQDAGRNPRLTIGPWSHLSGGPTHHTLRELRRFALPLSVGKQPAKRAPVRLFVMGQREWRNFPFWPPPGYVPTHYYLHSSGQLSTVISAGPGADYYRYDPADPTPTVGGARAVKGVEAGMVDNTELEARPDVLTYTTDVLAEDVEVIGEVSAEIWFTSSLPYADLFVRLCDVDEHGRSWNICDGLTGLTHADQTAKAIVNLWPTAHRFHKGHRIRVQISSGAFPRYNRNLGAGEPCATATTLRVAYQQVHHDLAHPSAIILHIRVAE